MIGGLDFSIDIPTQITLVVCFLFPCNLLFFTKLPFLVARNAIQFLYAFIFHSLFWITSIVFLNFYLKNITFYSILYAFFLYAGSMLVYLEIWGLLSRGYTLGLLLTFYKARKAISIEELAQLYRGGEGLEWLMKHRFAGLEAANLIKIDNNYIILTFRGKIIAYVYKISILFFGLRATG